MRNPFTKDLRVPPCTGMNIIPKCLCFYSPGIEVLREQIDSHFTGELLWKNLEVTPFSFGKIRSREISTHVSLSKSYYVEK